LKVHSHPGGDFLDAYREALSWGQLPSHDLLRPREGNVLHYDEGLRTDPLVFLAFKGELVGVFEADNLTVANEHQGKHLGPELILAGPHSLRRGLPGICWPHFRWNDDWTTLKMLCIIVYQ
jgi:hypothetical protein